ncbi:hypothetical protein CCR75_001071 [Bremia lactucae]|uniref:Calmodulin-lysine N-methyltransferase n=1 Tax=Bremia lactucae TaxID=4779 RepID=A0A976IHG0_BRELC|nr:hypothetical protein CCR75_001071 [Bremia lactucae]
MATTRPRLKANDTLALKTTTHLAKEDQPYQTHRKEQQATMIVQKRVQNEDDTMTEAVLEFHCNWKSGIGGSIWTSGELLAAYLEMHRKHYGSIFKNARVVEVGSGTGYVGLMVAACFKPAHVYLTDQAAYLDGLRRNAKINATKVRAGVQVHVVELNWGSLAQIASLFKTISSTSDKSHCSHDAALDINVLLGTDVAYLRELYEPLLHTITHLSTSRTLILLGLNRADTHYTFFQRLEQIGFEYYKISDFQLPQEYWGRDFGLFEIRRFLQN